MKYTHCIPPASCCAFEHHIAHRPTSCRPSENTVALHAQDSMDVLCTASAFTNTNEAAQCTEDQLMAEENNFLSTCPSADFIDSHDLHRQPCTGFTPSACMLRVSSAESTPDEPTSSQH